MDKGAIVGIIVLIAIIIAGAYLILQNQALLSSNSNLAIISLTDPPHVPQGTSALVIAYSSAQAHVVNSSSSSWVNVQGSGSVDLLSLVNVSQIIANSRIAANSTIDKVRFSITSANITINGVTSNVSVPNGRITANVTGNATQHVLVDLSPSIVAIYTNSSTLFVMIPSVKAVAFAGSKGYVQIGARSQLNSEESAEIYSSSNISISNEEIINSGNSSTVSVTVKNNGNSSIVIKHIIVSGSMQVLVKPFASIDASADSESSIGAQRRPQQAHFLDYGSLAALNSSIIYNGPAKLNSSLVNSSISAFNSTVSIIEGHVVRIGSLLINGSAIASGNVSINGSVLNIGNTVSINNGEIEVDRRATGVKISGEGAQNTASIESNIRARLSTLTTLGIQINDLRTVAFAVSSNGTVSLPRSTEEESANGYVLGPGAQQTFVFSGTITAGDGHVLISFVPDSSYSVYVQGEEGAHARANVTAS